MILAASTNLSSTCFASGVCGGGCAPPPPPVCAGGCGGGYSCGHYGCYRTRARAASSLTMSIDTLAKKAATPDEKFMACCIERSLPDSCLSKCSFRTYTKAALQVEHIWILRKAMYFKQDLCPIQAAADIHYCAAQGKDHSDCCARNGVATTLAGYKCMTFCDQRPGNVTQLDFTYLACYDRFENMKACFWHNLSTMDGLEQSFSHDERPLMNSLSSSRHSSSRARLFADDSLPPISLKVPGSVRILQAKVFN
ncbi:hypothetical protein KIN20_021446 [Parelaphostrongylus tenuis]|uniref:Domain of unknown function DB domain-containing protein n=1 Tax=Parelaphostrongylus tenuis TaxID=148309 RepID=A0AAD5QU70_PARTN|nr:hypothetical protein KIN20_021446 [Parelaphostrongylus tenuis]